MAYKHISEYYSIDEILAGAEPVPVIFQHVACDLGWLDEQSVDERDLPADSRVEMPWWLACQLAGRNSVALDLPRMLQPTYRALVLAEPEVVDLNAKAPFFYEFGIMYADLIRELDIGSMLCKVMEARYKEIVKRTVNRKQSESQEFVARLCNMERQLHAAKAAGLLQYTKFLNRSAIQLTISPVLASLPSFANSGSSIHGRREGGRSTNAAAPNSSSSNNPNALRNITNASNSRNAISGTATSQRGVGGGTGTQKHAIPSTAAAHSQSTLAQLNALNSANVPLASHQRKKYGMAATQAREQQQQAQSTQRAFDAAAATQATQQAQLGRKRKNTQQNT